MSELYPGLRRAAEICTGLARECDAKIEAASPYAVANVRRKAESRALRRAASRITDAMLDEPLPPAKLGGEGALEGELIESIGRQAQFIRAALHDQPEQSAGRCRRAGCITPTTHPSGMCEDHQPGFAQADEAEAA